MSSREDLGKTMKDDMEQACLIPASIWQCLASFMQQCGQLQLFFLGRAGEMTSVSLPKPLLFFNLPVGWHTSAKLL